MQFEAYETLSLLTSLFTTVQQLSGTCATLSGSLFTVFACFLKKNKILNSPFVSQRSCYKRIFYLIQLLSALSLQKVCTCGQGGGRGGGREDTPALARTHSVLAALQRILFSTLQLTLKIIITLLHLFNKFNLAVFNFVTISTFGNKMFDNTLSFFTSYNITLMYSETRLKNVLNYRTYILLLIQLAADQVNQISSST